jgi:hypothetical protein
MNLQEHIRKVLKEETEDIPKRTPLEKSITDFFKKSNDETSLFNFYEATKGRGWIKADQLNLESK